MKKASIDIGSNSILLLAASFNSRIEILLNESNVTGLGRDLDKDKKFIDIAMNESFDVLEAYVRQCQSVGIEAGEIKVTATEASRVATNAASFFDRIYKELGLKVTILTGEGEAFYSTKGILFDTNIKDDEITIMDIGGASTEIIQVETKTARIINSFSMPVGAVRVNNWKESDQELQMISESFEKFKDNLSLVQTEKLYCVAGTMTSVGNMFLKNKSFKEDEVNGLEMTLSQILDLSERFSGFTDVQFLEEFPFLGKRSRTIASGLYLAESILEKLKVKQVYISTYGLRYGTLISDEIEQKYIAM